MNFEFILSTLAANPSAPLDLAEVCLALASEEYPTLQSQEYLGRLATMAQVVHTRMQSFTALHDQIDVLRNYLFNECGFAGNQLQYYDPRNSYLNDVMDRRIGLPIALSAVTMAIGSRVGMNIVGVGLPGHFVVRAHSADGLEQQLFDPFHKGRLLTVEESKAMAEHITGRTLDRADLETVLTPVPLGLMLFRMLNNLKAVYLSQGDFARGVRVLIQLRVLAPHDTLQQRDLGASLLRAGRPGQAIEHLEAYLLTQPFDEEDVERLLLQARTELARWN